MCVYWAEAQCRNPVKFPYLTTVCFSWMSCPSFKRSALEVLRQPLEDGKVTISRSAAKITLPSSIMLVAAINPCPCGYMGDPKRECRCTVPQVQRYRNPISGPLLDRIDIHIEAPVLRIEELRNAAPGESSQEINARVKASRKNNKSVFRVIDIAIMLACPKSKFATTEI